MRTVAIMIFVLVVTAPLPAQPRQRRPGTPIHAAYSAEMAAKNAAEQFAAVRKVYEQDLEVLRRVRLADDALADTMQPAAAIQKAYEEVSGAVGLSSDFAVNQGVLATRQSLDDARRSPGSADFGRLRTLLRENSLVPASRVAIRNALILEEEMLAWFRVQALLTEHLRALTDLSSQSLRAAQRE